MSTAVVWCAENTWLVHFTLTSAKHKPSCRDRQTDRHFHFRLQLNQFTYLLVCLLNQPHQGPSLTNRIHRPCPLHKLPRIAALVSRISHHWLTQFAPSGGPGSTPDTVHHRRLATLQQHAAVASCAARTRAGNIPGSLQRRHVDHRDLRDKVAWQERRPLWRVRQSAVDDAESHDGASHHVLQIPLVCVSGWHLEICIRTGRVKTQDKNVNCHSLLFGRWNFQAEAQERVTCTTTRKADWRTKHSRHLALANSLHSRFVRQLPDVLYLPQNKKWPVLKPTVIQKHNLDLYFDTDQQISAQYVQNLPVIYLIHAFRFGVIKLMIVTPDGSCRCEAVQG